jgi:hypothetical protein
MSVTELDLARKARDSCVVYIYIAKLEEEERSNGSRLRANHGEGTDPVIYRQEETRHSAGLNRLLYLAL